jgi:hypothetical protein
MKSQEVDSVRTELVNRTHPSGRVEYVIQQRHFLFKWWWVDAWINSSAGAACQYSFPTLQQAKDNLWQFDDSKPTEEVVE